MGLEPTGHNQKPFEKMTASEQKQYLQKAADIVKFFHTPIEPNDTALKYWLSQASEYGLLFYPDGQTVSKNTIAEMAKDPKTMSDFVFDLILVEPDMEKHEHANYPFYAPKGMISVTKDPLFEGEFQEKRQAYYEKSRNAEQVKTISRLQGEARQAYLDDVKAVFDTLNAGGMNVGSPSLTECLKAAVDKGVVRTTNGDVPSKETIETLAKRPAFLKNLVFTQHLENSVHEFESYRLDVASDNPPTVKMYSTPLSPKDIVEMDKAAKAFDPREKVPGLYASVLLTDNQPIIDKYKKEMREFGYQFEHIEGMRAFRLKDEKQVYVYGVETPCNTPDDLVKAVRGVGKPTPPNKWGVLEFLRKGWHKIFKNLPDYQEYDKAKGLYEIDRYHLAKQAGFDVSKLTDSVKESEEKYGHLYDKYKTDLDVDAWVKSFPRPIQTKSLEAFMKDFKEALKQYPAIGKQIIEESPIVTRKMFDALAAVADPYAERSQVGYFDKKKLGSLSALAMAAECDLFASDMKERIFEECKALNADFNPELEDKALTEDREKKAAAKLKAKQYADEIIEKNKVLIAQREEKQKAAAGGGKQADVTELENKPENETTKEQTQKVVLIDSDDDEPENEEEIVNENEQVQNDEEAYSENEEIVNEEIVNEEEQAEFVMTDEEKEVLADEINEMTDGEKRMLKRLMMEKDIHIDNPKLRQAIFGDEAQNDIDDFDIETANNEQQINI